LDLGIGGDGRWGIKWDFIDCDSKEITGPGSGETIPDKEQDKSAPKSDNQHQSSYQQNNPSPAPVEAPKLSSDAKSCHKKYYGGGTGRRLHDLNHSETANSYKHPDKSNHEGDIESTDKAYGNETATHSDNQGIAEGNESATDADALVATEADQSTLQVATIKDDSDKGKGVAKKKTVSPGAGGDVTGASESSADESCWDKLKAWWSSFKICG
jgi:hypothetical protein